MIEFDASVSFWEGCDVTASKTPADRRIRARNNKAILDAAIDIFREKGFDGTSIAEIAAGAGLPKANVYYYFKSKETIYQTIIGDLIGEWDRALAHLTPDREPADALAAYIRAKLDFSRRHTAQSQMFANEAVHGGRFLTRQDRAHMQAITVEKARVFEGWMKAGKMRRLDPMHLFILLWAATQYYADFEVLAGMALETRRLRPSDYATAAETIVGIILRGCGITAAT
jgi:TetR/AcrR family transcriptional regulator